MIGIDMTDWRNEMQARIESEYRMIEQQQADELAQLAQETHKKRQVRNVVWCAACIVALGFFVLWLTGCSKDSTVAGRIEENAAAIERLRDMGFRGRLVLIMGGSHVGGAAFNVSGTSGFLEIEINPVPTSQPSE